MSSSSASSHSYQLNLCSVPLLQLLATTSSSNSSPTTSPSAHPAELGSSAKAVAATTTAGDDNATGEGSGVATSVGPAPPARAATAPAKMMDNETGTAASSCNMTERGAALNALNMDHLKSGTSAVFGKVLPFMKSAPKTDAQAVEEERAVPIRDVEMHKRHDSAIDTSPGMTKPERVDSRTDTSTIAAQMESTLAPLPQIDGKEKEALLDIPEVDPIKEVEAQLQKTNMEAPHNSAVDRSNMAAPMPEIEVGAGIARSGQAMVVQHDPVAHSTRASEDILA